MCGGSGSISGSQQEKRDPAIELMDVILSYNKSSSDYKLSKCLREAIAKDWDKVCVLAHRIHKEEAGDKVRDAAIVVAAYGSVSLVELIKENGSPELRKALKVLAEEAAKVKD